MAQRYCTNCGNELGTNDAFCASCGRPAHQIAAVATPEADVNVPPPPSPSTGNTGSSTASAPASVGTAAESEQPKKRGCIFYLVVTVVVLFVVVQIASLGGNEEGGSSGSGGGNQAVAPADEEQENQAAEPEPAQDPQPEPDPAPEPEPEPIDLSGSASQATDFFGLEEGLTVFEFSHQGQMNFIATLLDEQGTEVGYALGNEIGTVESSSALRIQRAGRYVLDVDADGPWSARVTQPRPADSPERTTFSGDNNAATPIFSTDSGLKRVTATHQGQGNFIINMLDSEGRETAFAMINEIGSGEYSTTVTVPQDGLYLFTVEAEGPWTINIE